MKHFFLLVVIIAHTTLPLTIDAGSSKGQIPAAQENAQIEIQKKALEPNTPPSPDKQNPCIEVEGDAEKCPSKSDKSPP